MHHYLGMSVKMYSEIKDRPSVKLKKLFYALRTSMACKWIIERSEIPPIVFQIMLNELEIDVSLRQRIFDLIDLKKTKNENYLHPYEVDINLFIEKCIVEAEHILNSLPSSKGKYDDLNLFFIKCLE